MTTQEVANQLIGLCREGKFDVAMQQFYSPEIVSIEGEGSPNPKLTGIEAVIEKSKQWVESVKEIHSIDVSDPIVAGNHFSCTMKNDITFKEMGRMTIQEICVYEVKDGKIVREQFFYNM